MRIWSGIGVSTWLAQLLWREAEAPTAATAPAAAREATGAPEILRKTTRFLLVAFVATTLTAQTAGIHLTAPVEADPRYPGCLQCVLQALHSCQLQCKPLFAFGFFGLFPPVNCGLCIEGFLKSHCPQCLTEGGQFEGEREGGDED